MSVLELTKPRLITKAQKKSNPNGPDNPYWVKAQLDDLRQSFYARRNLTPPDKPDVPPSSRPQVSGLKRDHSPAPVEWTCGRATCGRVFSLSSVQRTAWRRGGRTFYCGKECYDAERARLKSERRVVLRVPLGPVREAVERHAEAHGWPATTTACGYGRRKDGKVDSTQLKRVLGIRAYATHRRTSDTIKVSLAKRYAEGLGIDPQTLGVPT